MSKLFHAESRRKYSHYARPMERGWILPRVGHGDGYHCELVSVVGQGDRGRVVVTVLDREEVEHLRDTLTILLSATDRTGSHDSP